MKATRKKYKTRGFHLFKDDAIDHSLLDEASNRITHIVKGEYDTGIKPWAVSNTDYKSELFRVIQIHLADRAFHELLTTSSIGEQIAAVTGANELRIWGTQLYMKPPFNHKSAIVGWHRDSQHANFFESGVVSVWIPLDHVDEFSGALTYVEGSHDKKLFEAPCLDINENLEEEKYRIQQHSKVKSWKAHPVNLPKGGFSMHHWDLIHGSNTNFSKKHRAALAVGIATEKVRMNRQVNDYGYGKILSNQELCPILYKATKVYI